MATRYGPITDPYASHLPILRGLFAMVMPKRVLEFGQGNYSTPFFLGYPIDQLVSVETDPQWRWKRDDRHYVRTYRCSPEPFDLVFVDDGEDGEDGISRRVETIEFVLSRPHAVVVVHDVDRQEYADAINKLADEVTWVDIFNPCTAVIWPGENRTKELGRAVLAA